MFLKQNHKMIINLSVILSRSSAVHPSGRNVFTFMKISIVSVFLIHNMVNYTISFIFDITTYFPCYKICSAYESFRPVHYCVNRLLSGIPKYRTHIAIFLSSCRLLIIIIIIGTICFSVFNNKLYQAQVQII